MILRWCGLMGHPYVVLRPDDPVRRYGDGEWCCSSESPTLESALKDFPKDGRLFQQFRHRKWKEITLPKV